MKTLFKMAAFAAVALFTGKATSDGMCQHLVVDGFFNKLFMQNGALQNSVPVFQEVNVDTGDWADKHLVKTSKGYMRLFESLDSAADEDETWTMQFKSEYGYPGVCSLDNWNRSWQGNTDPNQFNDEHWAILSGTVAATRCIPFPGTIKGEMIELATDSEVFYGVGDCAQAVSMRYPNATGVQVDPWAAPWATKCYAAFGQEKSDEPNDNNAHRACFFRDTVRPGGLHGGVSMGTSYDSLEACVKAAKADSRAQKAEAIGVTYDKKTNECWYHNPSETAYYNHETQLHVIFAKPLARNVKCCIKKCQNAA